MLVQSVVPDGPADKAGIKGGNATVIDGGQQVSAGGDIITEVDGKAMTGMTDVANAISQKHPGDQVQLTLVHGSAKRTVTVTLGNQPARGAPREYDGDHESGSQRRDRPAAPRGPRAVVFEAPPLGRPAPRQR